MSKTVYCKILGKSLVAMRSKASRDEDDDDQLAVETTTPMSVSERAKMFEKNASNNSSRGVAAPALSAKNKSRTFSHSTSTSRDGQGYNTISDNAAQAGPLTAPLPAGTSSGSGAFDWRKPLPPSPSISTGSEFNNVGVERSAKPAPTPVGDANVSGTSLRFKYRTSHAFMSLQQ